MKPMFFLIVLLVGAAASPPIPAQGVTVEPDTFVHSTQMIVVTTSDWNAVEGHLQRYDRGTPHGTWRPVGEPIPIVVGRSGMGWGIGVIATDDRNVRRASDPVKKEGDGRSPAGVFALGTAFGYASQPLQGLKMPYLNLTSSIECVDDVNSKYYNRVLDRNAVVPDWNSSEHMRSVGEAYRWGIVVDHNDGAAQINSKPSILRGGSCVFLHIWGSSSQGTAGCTAMAQHQLETLLLWLDPKRTPLLVQLPASEYVRLINRWRLPPLVGGR